ncbi:phenylacetate-CoA oxygenase/reductase, PaaK subunit [Raoultella terrigena]|uniref:Phenylacetate-CoA oxygenase/reductase, PaaK subunit n=1 Tax=Raoultella terrigena TaxID=577 RepID=A0A3P8M181_RAOTE|nr:phenylacetate-CoA oxygenase/reductase, PaaK subunit [Raoultella terrigena]
MTLEVMVPQGHFGYQPQAERRGEYLAIAAGLRHNADDGDYWAPRSPPKRKAASP